MKKQVLCLAGNLTLVFSGSASASLVSVEIIAGPNQHPDGQHDTWQVIARFSDPFDQISAVNGLTEPGLNQLVFQTFGGELYNQGIFAGQPLNDFPTVGIGGEAWDSYVTIGETSFPSNTVFTPDFLGDWGGAPPTEQVILGDSFTEGDGAWFYFGEPPAVGSLPDAKKDNNTSDVVIAQFTIDAGGGFFLEGNIQWFDSNGSHNTPFTTVPAPGALAFLGLAGLVGIRRSRW